MNEKYTFPTASEALPFIASRLLDIGQENGSRNGRVREILNAQIVITDPVRREILTISRKANVFAQIAETCWVLAGRNDIGWLSAYLPRAVDYSDDGETWRGGYGPRLRGGYFGFDQVEHVVDLLKADPLTRRAVIAIYEPTVDASPGKDIPCNDFLQFQSRLGELHLTVTVRSNDLMWGWSGINAFEWSTLQEIVASLLGIKVGTLTFNIGSLHLYEPHWGKANTLIHEDLAVETIPFNPGRNITTLAGLDDMLDEWFKWEVLCRVGNVDSSDTVGWADPLFQSWAEAIAYYWTRDTAWLRNLQGTALHTAIARTPVSVYPAPVQRSSRVGVGVGATGRLNETARAFYEFASELHAAKHASYGDSWKKRGEKLSILANIARKVDRLGADDLFETSADTWLDLMVYLAKYLCWLNGSDDGPKNVDFLVLTALFHTEDAVVMFPDIALEIQQGIVSIFNKYADDVDMIDQDHKRDIVRDLLMRVAPIARDVWLAEQPAEYRGADLD